MLDHAIKVVERIFEHRLRQQTDIDDMQLGFMKGEGTKVMMSKEYQKPMQKAARCPCGVRGRGVGNNSILVVRSGYTRSVLV